MVATNDARNRQPTLAFGHFLKRHRGAADLTQEELAERAGVSARLISDLERGLIQRPRRETVQQLANGLDLAGPAREAFIALARGHSPLGVDAAPTAIGLPHNRLPIPPSPIVGRLKETAAAMALLLDQEVRLLTLTGPGGVGKTRLAIEVATNLQDVYPGGAYFVDLAPVSDARLVLQAIARAMGMKTSNEHGLRGRLVGALRDRRVLLVLDNVEHVTDAAGEIAMLLGECDQVTLLATSRAPLHLRAEREYRVEPLALPDLGAAPPLVELAQVPAVDFFLSRVSAVNRGFVLTTDNARAVAEITVRLDGLPLALELAAARAKVLSPAAMLTRLEHRLPLLTGGARDLPARLRAMRSAIDWSHELLHPSEQRLFRRLAVFVGGATLHAAEWMSGESSPTVLDDLSALVDKSLLHVGEDAGGERRFGMLATLREYGLERLAEAGEATEIRERHAAWCLDLAERAEPELNGARQAAWLAMLESEHDNLRGALGWAIDAGDAEVALRLAGALCQFWNVRDHYAEGRRWLEQALALGQTVDPAIKAKAILGLGITSYRQGDYQRASVLHDALTLYRSLDDKPGIAAALGCLGKVAQAQGDYHQATPLEEEALALFRELGDGSRAHNMLVFLGHAAHDLGNYARAETLLDEALALARELGAPHTIAVSLNQIAIFEIVRGNYARATALQQEVIALWRDLGYKAGLKLCLENLAWIAARQHEAARAARIFGALDVIREQIGSPGRQVDRDISDRHMAEARAMLGAEAFGEAWETGRAMSIEEALAFALRGERQTTAGDWQVARRDK